MTVREELSKSNLEEILKDLQANNSVIEYLKSQLISELKKRVSLTKEAEREMDDATKTTDCFYDNHKTLCLEIIRYAELFGHPEPERKKKRVITLEY